MENHESASQRELTAEERLARLEEEAARLREELSSKKAESPAAAVAEPAPEPVAEPVREVSPEDIEAAERLVQRANMELTRGNKEFAQRYLTEAEQLAPNSSLVLEALGDVALADRKQRGALDYYKRAKEADPKNQSADKKHADLVFSSQAASAGLIGSASESLASTKSATILSVMLPGLGQLTMGMYVKGAIFMSVWLLLLAFVIVTKVPQQIVSVVTGKGSVEPLGPLVMFAAFVFWIINVMDMNMGASLASKRQKIIEHPSPPEGGEGLKF